MATVFHVIERYLELSSGFVHGQISRSRHDGVVLSRLSTENGHAFPVHELRRVNRVVDLLPAGRTRDRAVRAAVAAAARRVGADIAHAHFGYALPYATVLAERGRLPLVASLHGHDVTAWAAEAPWAYPPATPSVSAVVVPSRWLGERVVALGFAPESVRVIPSGVDTEFFAPTALPTGGPPVVGFVGRFVEKKGLDVLFDAWPRVTAAVPEARLRLLGSGPLAERVANFAAVTPRVDHIQPDPARPSAQARDVIRSATVVVTPSHTAANGDAESLLLVNLEAQASGRAVVTTSHGGIPEYVTDGRTALVVPESDAAALADALVRVLADRDLAVAMGAAGPAVASRYDVNAMAASVDDLYDELLERRSTK